jgi:hypothetical protein
MGVADCSKYSSKAACEKNDCGVMAGSVPDICKWIVLNAELGTGVCSSVSRPACSACASLGCTKELCTTISPDCYYDALPNGLDPKTFAIPRCVAKQDMACRYYDTAADCGTRAAVFNVRYSQGTRGLSGDTNARTTASDDFFSIGSCSWQTDRCIKNADASANPQGDDCEENGYFAINTSCVQDSTPPITTFLLASSYPASELNALPFTVSDDTTPAAEIKTYVCFHKTTDPPCYPKQRMGGISPLPAEGNYVMRYYSEDRNGNLEVIKQASFAVVTSPYATLQTVEVFE